VALSTGVRLPVGMAEVFPAGCHLLPDSITEAQDWDAATRVRTPTVDKITGQRVWHVRVVDMDQALEGRCGARMAFSLRATGLKAAARPAPSKDAA